MHPLKIECSACLSKYKDPRDLDCGHTFCFECIKEQFKTKKACPVCMQKCLKSADALVKNTKIMNLLDKSAKELDTKTEINEWSWSNEAEKLINQQYKSNESKKNKKHQKDINEEQKNTNSKEKKMKKTQVESNNPVLENETYSKIQPEEEKEDDKEIFQEAVIKIIQKYDVDYIKEGLLQGKAKFNEAFYSVMNLGWCKIKIDRKVTILIASSFLILFLPLV
jgi:hypothetical protein